MPPEKYEALKESMRTEGFVEPLVVQKKGLQIIGGHQRLRAVKEIAIEASVAPPDLPCIVLDIDDARAKKLNMKLNNLKGEYEARMLGELLIDLYEEPSRVTEEEAMSLGFTQEEVVKHMHIVEPPVIVPTDGDEWEQHHRLTRELEVRCEARRRRLMALGMSLPPTRLCAHLVRGNPAERIVDLADSLDAELVVMATHGRRRWRRMLLGTIAEEVVRNAPCAVLVVGEQRQLSDVPGNAQHRRDRHTIRAASSS